MRIQCLCTSRYKYMQSDFLSWIPVCQRIKMIHHTSLDDTKVLNFSGTYKDRVHTRKLLWKYQFLNGDHIRMLKRVWWQNLKIETCLYLKKLVTYLYFLHDRPWISPWIKSTSNELDITCHVFASQLSGHCDFIAKLIVTSSAERKASEWDTGMMCEDPRF